MDEKKLMSLLRAAYRAGSEMDLKKRVTFRTWFKNHVEKELAKPETKNVILDHRDGKKYWDNGIIRNFETVLQQDITWEKAKKFHPDIIKPS